MRRQAYPQLRDVDWLRRRYIGQGASVADIAAHLGCTAKTVYKALKTADIPRHGPTRVHPALTDHDWLRRRYLLEDASLAVTVAPMESRMSAAGTVWGQVCGSRRAQENCQRPEPSPQPRRGRPRARARHRSSARCAC